MAESNSPRLGLRRWTADTDTWGRPEFDANNAARELLLAMFTQGSATKGDPNVGGRFYYDNTTDSIYYDTGARWVTIQRQADASLTVYSGYGLDPTASSGAPAGTPNVFRRGDYVTVVVGGINRPGGSWSGTAMRVPTGFRPARPVPIELYSRPDRNYATGTIGTDGTISAGRTWTSGEFVYGTVTYLSP